MFHRTGRGVELTDDGEAYASDLTPAFDLLIEATSRFAAPRSRSQLVISSEVPFAALWLVPRLGGFTSNHPEIDLVLDPNNRLVDFTKNEADLGIRYGLGRWRDVEAVKLIDSEITPVCSPSLLNKSAVRSPSDLTRAILLQEDTKQHWLDWIAAAGLTGKLTPSGPTLKGHLAIAAAEAGQGFALADQVTAADALVAKRLVRPFDISILHLAYYLVWGRGTKKNKAATSFRHWITQELEKSIASVKGLRRP